MLTTPRQAYLHLQLRIEGERCRVYIRFMQQQRHEQLALLTEAEAITSAELTAIGVELVRDQVAKRLAEEGELGGRVVVVIEQPVSDPRAAPRRFP